LSGFVCARGHESICSVSLFANRAAREQHVAAFADSIREKQVTPKLSGLVKGQHEILVLEPVARSLLALGSDAHRLRGTHECNQLMKASNGNVAVVRRLYEARGNPEVIRQVLAPDVRWEVVEGFPHSDVYLGLSGVSDFFTRLFSDFEIGTEPSEFFRNRRPRDRH
jgi:hypothetical protein